MMGIGGIIILSAVLGGLLVSLAFLIFTRVDAGRSKEKKVPPKGNRPIPIKPKLKNMKCGGVVHHVPEQVGENMVPKKDSFVHYINPLDDFAAKIAKTFKDCDYVLYRMLLDYIDNPTKYNSIKIKRYKEELEDKNLHGITADEAFEYQKKIGAVFARAHKEEQKMKIYHTETQADYDALMVELEETGAEWASGRKPTKEGNWNEHRERTCIKLNDDDEITYEERDYFIRNGYKIEKYKVTDNVNNPSHYNTGGIETLDYIKAKTKDYPSYAAGNILKYVSRYEHKNGIDDLKKAQFYLNDLIEWMESD